MEVISDDVNRRTRRAGQTKRWLLTLSRIPISIGVVAEQQAASTNTLGRFETEVLTSEANLEELTRLNAEWVEQAMANTLHRRLILDMDSFELTSRGKRLIVMASERPRFELPTR